MSLRRLARRFSFKKTKDSEKESYAEIEGLEGESFTEVMRIQQHGFSSHPPVGSHCIAIALNGESDAMVVLGGEIDSSRPTDLAEGDSKFYNAGGVYLHLEGGDLKVVAPTAITLTVGGCSLKITGAGFDFTGGYIKHDGVVIDKTHHHKDSTPGVGLTGVPN